MYFKRTLLRGGGCPVNPVLGQSQGVKFHCSECGHISRRKGDLARHMNTVHSKEGKGKFQCDHCSYSANRKDQVKQHGRFNHTSVDFKDHSVKQETSSIV